MALSLSVLPPCPQMQWQKMLYCTQGIPSPPLPFTPNLNVFVARLSSVLCSNPVVWGYSFSPSISRSAHHCTVRAILVIACLNANAFVNWRFVLLRSDLGNLNTACIIRVQTHCGCPNIMNEGPSERCEGNKERATRGKKTRLLVIHVRRPQLLLFFTCFLASWNVWWFESKWERLCEHRQQMSRIARSSPLILNLRARSASGPGRFTPCKWSAVRIE